MSLEILARNLECKAYQDDFSSHPTEDESHR